MISRYFSICSANTLFTKDVYKRQVEPPGMVRLVDGEYLPFFFLCQADKPLDVLELFHVFSLVKQDFTAVSYTHLDVYKRQH